jgi:hypothetical protein
MDCDEEEGGLLTPSKEDEIITLEDREEQENLKIQIEEMINCEESITKKGGNFTGGSNLVFTKRHHRTNSEHRENLD